MEEVVNEIMEFIKQKTADFSNMDQAQMFSDLESRMADMNADAMKREYMGSIDYLLDGI
mgnify:CR=1 FL=1